MSKQSDIVKVSQGAAGDPLYVDSTNNRVGIGTSSPSEALEVATSVNGTPTRIELVANDTGGTTRTGSVFFDADTNTVGFRNGGSNVLHADSSGNVSVYSASFVRRMNIAGTDPDSSDYISIGMLGVNNTINSGIDFCRGDGVTKSGIRSLAQGSYSKKGLSFLTNNASDYTTEATEKLRITSGGAVQFYNNLNNTAYGANFAADSNNRDVLTLSSSTTGSVGLIHFLNPNGFLAAITTSGSSVQYNTSSDYRLKENVQPLTGAADRVLSLNPVRFTWKADGSRVDGFLAHEAQEVVPEAITGEKDAVRIEEYVITPEIEETYDEHGNVLTEPVPAVIGTREVPEYQSIDQSKLVPLLTAALQEALTEIAALKDRVTALEGN